MACEWRGELGGLVESERWRARATVGGAVFMKVLFRGGVYDGRVEDLSPVPLVIELPHVQVNYDAIPIRNDDIKRHSWDDDALTVSTVGYKNTGHVEDDAAIFVPLGETGDPK